MIRVTSVTRVTSMTSVTRVTAVARVTRVTWVIRLAGVNTMTRVRYLSQYLECLSRQDFRNVAYVGCFRFVCVFVFVVVFVIVFVFSSDCLIPIVMRFQNMSGYMGL